jgi:hypothetical protein
LIGIDRDNDSDESEPMTMTLIATTTTSICIEHVGNIDEKNRRLSSRVNNTRRVVRLYEKRIVSPSNIVDDVRTSDVVHSVQSLFF